MAVPTNTFQTFAGVGLREELSDKIFRLDYEETPFMSMCKKGKTESLYTEWQTEALPAVNSSNAVIQGDAHTSAAPVATVRVGNYCQTSDRGAAVSDIMEIVSKAGRKSEMAHQMALYAAALKRDIESIITKNQASLAGNSSTATLVGGLPTFFSSNIDTNGGSGGGFAGGVWVVRANGTPRDLTEDMVKALMQTIFTATSKVPGTFMTGVYNRTICDTFSGFAQRTHVDSAAQLTATIEVYKGPFGLVKFVPNALMSQRDAYLLDPAYFEFAMLIPFKYKDLADEGHAERKMVTATYTVKSLNEKASGAIFDLTTAP